jgi:hypothetical protein
MEYFSGGLPTLDYIESQIASCDLFINLLADSMGSYIDDAATESYIEYEYARARQYNKPIISLLLNEKEFKQVDRPADLKTFRQQLQHGRSLMHERPVALDVV